MPSAPVVNEFGIDAPSKETPGCGDVGLAGAIHPPTGFACMPYDWLSLCVVYESLYEAPPGELEHAAIQPAPAPATKTPAPAVNAVQSLTRFTCQLLLSHSGSDIPHPRSDITQPPV